MYGIAVSVAGVPFAVLLDIALGSALSMVSADVVVELVTSPAIVAKLVFLAKRPASSRPVRWTAFLMMGCPTPTMRRLGKRLWLLPPSRRVLRVAGEPDVISGRKCLLMLLRQSPSAQGTLLSPWPSLWSAESHLFRSHREAWEDQLSWEEIRAMNLSQGALSSQGLSVSPGPGMQDAELPVVQDSAPLASVALQDGPAQLQGAEAATPAPLAGLAAAAKAALENWSTLFSRMSIEYALMDLHRQTKCASTEMQVIRKFFDAALDLVEGTTLPTTLLVSFMLVLGPQEVPSCGGF